MKWTMTDGTIVTRPDYCTCGLTGGCKICNPSVIIVQVIKTTMTGVTIPIPFCREVDGSSN